MKIWMISNTSPQHVGNTDGGSHVRDLIKKANENRHFCKVGARVVDGNKVFIALFDTFPRMKAFKDRNPDLTFSEVGMAR